MIMKLSDSLVDKLQFVGTWIIASNADKPKLIGQSVIEKRSPAVVPLCRLRSPVIKSNAWG
jgi:hypothetical protein